MNQYLSMHFSLYNKYNKDTERILAELTRQLQYLTRKEYSYNNRINELQAKIDRIEERWIDGKISYKKRDELERESSKIIDENRLILSSIHEQMDSIRSQGNAIAANSTISKDNLTFIDKYNIVHKSIKKIIVEKTGKFSGIITIYNNYNSFAKVITYNSHRSRGKKNG